MIDDKGQEFIELEDDAAKPLTPAQEAEIAGRISAAIAGLDLKQIISDSVSDELREMTRKRIARRGEPA